jgi:hypothetical protein
MTFHPDGLLLKQGGRFQAVIVDVAENYRLLVLDVAIFDLTTSCSSGTGTGTDDGDPQVLTGTKGVAAHCEPMDRRPTFISVTSSIPLIDKCLEIG